MALNEPTFEMKNKNLKRSKYTFAFKNYQSNFKPFLDIAFKKVYRMQSKIINRQSQFTMMVLRDGNCSLGRS